MRKIFLISVSIILFAACNDTSKDFEIVVQNVVTNAEIITNEHDVAVLNALESNNSDIITEQTKITLAKLAYEQDQLALAKIPSNGENLKNAAKDYIESLVAFVNVQVVYTEYTDTISEQDILIMDKMNLDAALDVEVARSGFVDAQKVFIQENKISFLGWEFEL